MRKLWVVVVVLLVGAVGCRKRVPPVTVIIPNTPEGLKCERECAQIFHSCQAGNGKNAKVCRAESEACRETCPGAMFSDGRPARGGIASGIAAPAPNEEAKAPVQPAPGASCVASELPEWQGASAVEKKALLERCRAPAPSP